MPARARVRPFLHPLHAILLAFPIAFFTGAVAMDATYLGSAEMQWSNFAAWLIFGGLLWGGLALAWALLSWLRGRRGPAARRRRLYLVLLAAMWLIALVNMFQHSRDGWSSVGTAGILMSALCAALALAAGWIGHDAAGAEA